MQPDRRTHAFLNSIDELLTGHRPEIDERLMSDILGDSPPTAMPQSPVEQGNETPADAPPSHHAIAERAYEIYVRTGRLSGTSVQNWLFAKSELEHSARAAVVTRNALSPAQTLGIRNNSDVSRRGKSSGG